MARRERLPGDVFINIFQMAQVGIATGMIACAARLLDADGVLLIYGPFMVNSRFTTRSDEEFHNLLRSAGVPEWGLKDVADLNRAAQAHGLTLAEQIDVLANNFALLFRCG